MRLRQNGRNFADDIFKCIFFNENCFILIEISLKFVAKGPINNISALVRRWAIIWINDGLAYWWCIYVSLGLNGLTHWGRATHICIGKLTTIVWDNGLSPGRRQAIIWNIAEILLIGPLGTNFSEILIRIQTFSFKKMHLKMSSAKWHPFVSASMC